MNVNPAMRNIKFAQLKNSSYLCDNHRTCAERPCHFMKRTESCVPGDLYLRRHGDS